MVEVFSLKESLSPPGRGEVALGDEQPFLATGASPNNSL